MKDFLQRNKAAVSLLALTFAVGIFIAVAQGCSLAELIPVKTPVPMQKSIGVEPKVTLAEAPYVRERYVNEVQTTIRQFDDAVERASIIRDIGTSLLNTGLQAAEGPVAALPMGGVLMGVLAGLAGLLMDKPGTAKRIAQEKQDSYNAGIDKAKGLS